MKSKGLYKDFPEARLARYGYVYMEGKRRSVSWFRADDRDLLTLSGGIVKPLGGAKGAEDHFREKGCAIQKIEGVKCKKHPIPPGAHVADYTCVEFDHNVFDYLKSCIDDPENAIPSLIREIGVAAPLGSSVRNGRDRIPDEPMPKKQMSQNSQEAYRPEDQSEPVTGVSLDLAGFTLFAAP